MKLRLEYDQGVVTVRDVGTSRSGLVLEEDPLDELISWLNDAYDDDLDEDDCVLTISDEHGAVRSQK